MHSQFLLGWLIHHSPEQVATPQSAMIFAPHPDDETLGCGGLIALKRVQGAQVWVVLLTNGEASYLYDRTANPATLPQTRLQEAQRAMAILGVPSSHLVCLNQPDGQLNTLSEVQRQSLVQVLSELIEAHQPEELYVPHKLDVHSDHEMTYGLAKQALARSSHSVTLWQYPVWIFWNRLLFWNLSPQDLTHAYRVPIREGLEVKRKAIASYRSQHSVLPPGFLQNCLRPYELFFKDL
jgi:LmbE family N-acetylglucosaminyl deacetylase